MARRRTQPGPEVASKTYTAETFPSVRAFVERALSPTVTEAGSAQRAQHSASMSDSPVHYGAASLEALGEAMRTVTVPEFARMAVNSAHAATATGRRVRSVRSVAGGAVSVPDYLSGRPDCMRRAVRRPAPDPVAMRLRLVVGFHGGVRPSEVMRHGAATLAALDSIVRSGRRLEVWATIGCSIAEGERSVDVLLKSADSPMDWQRIAFFACHTGATRGLFFAWQDVALVNAERKRAGFGRGAPVGVPRLPLKAGPSVTIPAMVDRAKTAEEILAAIVD